MTVSNREGCELFGTGFDYHDIECMACKKNEECRSKTERENVKISAGVQPPIPRASNNPQIIPFLLVTKPVETLTEIILTLRFNKPLLKKLLGWEAGTTKEDLNGKLITALSMVEKRLKAKFINQPDILEEIDKLFEDESEKLK